LQYDETHRGALNNLGVIALATHHYDLAEDWLRRAEKIDPRNAKTHFLLAKALMAKGKSQAAEEEIGVARQLRPNQHEFAELEQEIAHLP
jgi:Flp pilus assembly protein TadD